MRAALRHPAAWWALLVLGCMPWAWLLAQTLQDQLGPNPAEALIRATGDWTLRSLCVVLAVAGVLASIAWPSLQSQLQRGRRADAVTALLRVQLARYQ